MRKIYFLIFVLTVLAISSCKKAETDFEKKHNHANFTVKIKSKSAIPLPERSIQLKWLNCFSNENLHEKLGVIDSKAFSKLYPELGIPQFLKENHSKKQLTQKELIKQNRNILIKESQKHLFNLWKNNKKEFGLYKIAFEKNQCFPLVAFENNEPVGFALFCNSYETFFGKKILKNDEIVLGRIAISPQAQGIGLAGKLIFGILKLFPNINKITLNTDISPDIVTGKPKNSHGCNVYKHYGFKPYIETRVKPYNPKKKQYFVWTKSN